MKRGPVTEFMLTHYKHFNAASVIDASAGWVNHLESGGKMFVTLAGAMSTAELGKSLAEMIRQGKIHGICCTGANLEEDIFNLVAHNDYQRIPDWRGLTAEDEMKLKDRGMNRVTDTCIPEHEAMRKIEALINKEWQKADKAGESHPPHYYFWQLLQNAEFKKEYQIDPKDSWMIAAMEKNLPIYTPGWEDSTLGNMYAAANIDGRIKNVHTINSGIQTMIRLAQWYTETSANNSIGFFQIGGGIAGDFPICVVPMLEQDLERNTPLWGYFCQISDSTTSYGGYSGAVPNEKITWGKLDIHTPKYIIESDATIVAPLVFAYVLNW
jgi:deoxyhypusine synthase